MRKTANIANILNKANAALSSNNPHMSEDEAKSFRYGICTMIESILMDNDVYMGFSYLESAGKGVDSQGFLDWKDESRRHYHLHHILD